MYDAGDYNSSKLVHYLSQGKGSAKRNYYSNIHLFPQRNPSHVKPKNPAHLLYQINKQVSARRIILSMHSLLPQDSDYAAKSRNCKVFFPSPKHPVQAVAHSSKLSYTAL